MNKKKGFTLIELLIVIAIIGIVAAIAIPNLLTALQKGKQKATMGDMKSIGAAIESYMTDMYMAPGAGGVTLVSGLATYLTPFHTKNLPQKDGWGGDFQYQSGAVGAGQDLYSVISYGRGSSSDGIAIANNNYVVNTMKDFENDICFSNGNFTYGPKVR
ncbi:MAG: prepilin-type N-terminal cleavage/methylation domain-containing protein [Candidatus Omnitrophota bacterium]